MENGVPKIKEAKRSWLSLENIDLMFLKYN
jgi:hypothetical protein